VIFGALNIAASGLKTQKQAIDVVSHNIANVNTPGYSRQTTQLASLAPEQLGKFDFGRGVNLSTISRSVDNLVNQAMLKNNPQKAYWTEVKTGLNSIESVFGSLQGTGLSAAMNDFFSAAQKMANTPADNAQQTNMRTKSATLSLELSNMSKQLANTQRTTDQKIDQNIISANTILKQIASLNVQISQHESSAQGLIGAANDLRDQRDQAVRDLSTLLPVQKVHTADGGLLLQTMGGDLLVQGNHAQQLERGAVASSGFANVVIVGSAIPVAGLDQGGAIGGSIALRDGRLAGYIKDLNSIAVNLSFAMNKVNASGVGSSRLSQVQSSLGVVNAANPVNDISQNNPFAGQIVNGSFSIHVYDSAGVPLTPTSNAAITITAGTSTMASIATSISNAGLSGVTASVDAVSGKLLINAGTAGNTIGFSNDTSNFLAAYQINSIFQGNSAASLKISDAVQADAGMISTGQIAANSTINVGDNKAALLMVGLQNKAISIDASASLSLNDRASVLSTKYGNDVSLSKQQETFFKAESDSLSQQRQAFSGVNVDEELVSMIKFQRAYQASAKVIQTSNQMLDSLMGLIR